MDNHRRLLRSSYWVAAIADFVIAFLVLIPERMGIGGFVYPMGLMSAVAFSWGVMLIVADRRPVERRNLKENSLTASDRSQSPVNYDVG